MKRIVFISILGIFYSISLFGQQNVAINTTGAAPDASAILDISSTNKGLLIPRLALTQTSLATPVTTPATSLLVYNTATVNDVTHGYYFWDGTTWVSMLSGGIISNDWALLGNAGTNPSTNFLGTTDAQDMVIRTNNTEKMRVESGGNIGIGTNNPNYKLHLYGTSNNAADVYSQTDAARIVKHWFVNANRSWSVGQIGTTQAPNYSFQITDETAGSPRMSITTGGDVGIGTTSPTARLQVSGNAYITTYLGVGTAPNTTNRIYAYHSSGDPSILGHNTFQTTNGLCGVAGTTPSAGNGYLGTYMNGIRAGVYGEAGSYSSSINYAGYFDGKAVVTDSLGIGTDDPQSLIHIYSTNSYDGLRLERGPSWGYWVIGTAATNNLWFTYNGALTAWIDHTSGVWTTSDRRLKKDFTPIGSCLDKVLKLEALEYTFIRSENNRRDIGFVSQDVEKLFPQLVQEQDGYFFMNYSLFSVVAIKAVQEQQSIIEKQQQEIDDLRKEIDEIKKLIY